MSWAKTSYLTRRPTVQNILVTKPPPGKTFYGAKCPMKKRPMRKTSYRKNVLQDKMSYMTKRPTGKNVLWEKTSYGKNDLWEKHPTGKMSARTKCPMTKRLTGQNVL